MATFRANACRKWSSCAIYQDALTGKGQSEISDWKPRYGWFLERKCNGAFNRFCLYCIGLQANKVLKWSSFDSIVWWMIVSFASSFVVFTLLYYSLWCLSMLCFDFRKAFLMQALRRVFFLLIGCYIIVYVVIS